MNTPSNSRPIQPSCQARDDNTCCTKAKIEKGRCRRKIEKIKEKKELNARWWSGLYKDEKEDM